MDAKVDEVKKLKEKVEVLELAVRRLHAMIATKAPEPMPLATREAEYLH